LHARVPGGEYVVGQTDLPPILDRNQFNCVSSAVLKRFPDSSLLKDDRKYCEVGPSAAFQPVAPSEVFRPAADSGRVFMSFRLTSDVIADER
jgi:hypothetical protein